MLRWSVLMLDNFYKHKLIHFYDIDTLFLQSKIIFGSYQVHISLKKRNQLRLAQSFERKKEVLNRAEEDQNKRSLVNLLQ